MAKRNQPQKGHPDYNILTGLPRALGVRRGGGGGGGISSAALFVCRRGRGACRPQSSGEAPALLRLGPKDFKSLAIPDVSDRIPRRVIWSILVKQAPLLHLADPANESCGRLRPLPPQNMVPKAVGFRV